MNKEQGEKKTMLQTLLTVIPIFVMIFLGAVAARIGLLPDEAKGPLNRLVFYYAIPAFLFQAIAGFPMDQGFNAAVIVTTLSAPLILYLIGWCLLKLSRVSTHKAGILAIGGCHGNLAYIGLPVAFYFLGEKGLAQAGIIAGFLVILQNIMSIGILQSFAPAQEQSGGKATVIFKLMKNPVIISCLLGIIVSELQLPVPEVISRTLKMLGQLAPPAALLLIGASLSFTKIKAQLRPVSLIVITKLVLLPGLALLLFSLFGIDIGDNLPAFILLGAPTATVTYVLAQQMKTDAELAVAIISATTFLSAVSLSLWLMFLKHLV
jgi:predicted permease